MSRKRTYTDEDRRAAALVWAVTGTDLATSERTGIPRETIRYWRTDNSGKWDELMAQVRQEKDKELESRLSGLVEKLFSAIESEYNALSPKDKVWSGAVLFDKLRIQRGLPSSYSAKGSEAERLGKLADRLEALQNQGKQPVGAKPTKPEDSGQEVGNPQPEGILHNTALPH